MVPGQVKETVAVNRNTDRIMSVFGIALYCVVLICRLVVLSLRFARTTLAWES